MIITYQLSFNPSSSFLISPAFLQWLSNIAPMVDCFFYSGMDPNWISIGTTLKEGWRNSDEQPEIKSQRAMPFVSKD
jgi:hypothetical protein